MDTKRILVVDDEESLLKIIEYALDEAGFAVRTAMDCDQAKAALQSFQPDLIILDVMLPGCSGLEFCREVRQKWDVPIIMLSARSEEIDKILGLELGADDYVTKPFSPRELVSRVRAQLRRVEATPTREARISVADLAIDPDSHEVFMGDEVVHLTNTEFQILSLLARTPGKAFSRAAILSHLWSGGFVGDERTVDVHIHNLRDKVEPNAQEPEYILTVRGVGYRLRSV